MIAKSSSKSFDEKPSSSLRTTERDPSTTTRQERRRRAFLPPKEVLQTIHVPASLAEIRAYVRWEEAGKPEGMPAEWQAAEFARALDDLRHELIEGTPLNEIRRRYNVMTVNNGEDDVPMKFPREVEEYKREREEMMRKATAMGVSRGEQSQQQQQQQQQPVAPPTQPSQQLQPEQSQQQQQRRRFVTPADVVKTKIANSMTRRIGDKEFTNDSGSVDSFDEAVSFDQENEGAMNTTEASSRTTAAAGARDH